MAEIEEGYEDIARLLRSALLDHEWQPGRPLSVHRMHKYDGRCGICLGDVANMVVVLLGAIENHPTQTIRHYAPTQWAYDQACKALDDKRQRIDRARVLHECDNSNPYGSWCSTCMTEWPCATSRALAAVSASEGEAEDA